MSTMRPVSHAGDTSLDAAMLRRALDAALLGPEADPNPRVGAVVLDADGVVAGMGHHRGAGTPHAEVEALREAGRRAAGGTAYVSLEPCAHHGRTPPCTRALVEAGVRRVVYAVADPDPKAAGGAVVLRAQGVETEHRPSAEAEAVLRHWSFATRHGRPWVTWKTASTLDGRVAAADGSSAWVTSPQARADVHDLRSRCGAVVVGTGTALADDPSLTARHPDGTPRERQPLRVVLGRTPLPRQARLHDGAAPMVQLPGDDLAAALAGLHGRGVRRALLEGGPTLTAAFWRAGLVEEVVAYVAPALLGAGPAAVGDLGITSMAGIARLQIDDVARIGPDVRITAHPVAGQEEE
jgi:diaminohydroxyphosphoribosylaminopyrimidine deaminase / 5-amino-6-(5-phosphoribosylamino)uracil reductase